MAGVLGRAFVQVFADLSKFSPGLREKIKESLDEQTKNMPMDELDKSAEKAGESAAENVGKGMDSKIENEMDKEGKKGGSSFGSSFSKAVGLATAAFMPALIGLGVEAASALAPAAVALAGTIPAAAGLAIGALAAVKLATSGVGAALKDAFDPAKAAQFAAAMKKLAPSAQGFVKEIQALHPAFHQLQQDVQQVFFNQLEGTLTRVSKQLLPTLHGGLVSMSVDVGKLGNNLLQAFGNSKDNIAVIFDDAHKALVPFIPLVGKLVQTFITIGAVAGPLFDSLSGGFAKLLTNFTTFIGSAASSGGLSKFFGDALTIIKQLGSLLGNVFDLVGGILKALQTTGGQGLGVLSRIIGELAVFFNSASGQTALIALFTLLNTALTSLFQIITPLLPVIGQLVGEFATGLTNALIKVTPYLVEVATWLAKHPDLLKAAAAAFLIFRGALIAVSVAEAIMDALNPVTWIVLGIAAIAAGAYLIYKNWGALTDAVKTAWSAIGDFFKGIWDWIKGIGTDIGTWFTVTLPAFFSTLPTKVFNALAAIPGLLFQVFTDALHAAGEAVGLGIGIVLAILIKAPGLIWDAIKAIPGLVGSLFKLVWTNAKAIFSDGISLVWGLIKQLPGLITSVVTKLPGIIGGAFKTAWNDAKTFVRDGANDVVSFVKALPGRISGFMRNVGSDILGGLKSGINSVISGFNSGINKIQSIVHVGLPHIPLLASGGLISSPTLAVVGEAGPEAVIPMSSPGKALAMAQRTGLLDMIGTIGGGSSMGNVTVYLGTRQITDILNVQIDQKLNAQATELAYGTR